ncbi:MAG: DNA-3-methyladenine glycosylase family protein [Acidimicrobiales bacterium]
MDRWAEATALLASRDTSMAAFIAEAGPCLLVRRRHPGGPFAALARAILYQQLATGAAAAIHGRFAALYGGRPTPEAVLATPDADLRAVGLSGAKAASVKDLAAKVLDGSVRVGALSRVGDDELVARLCAVRGIGPWTAEMFLMFQLNRPDVWPVGDLGVRAGYARIHGLAAVPTARELVGLGDRYRPWRSVAAWYCWRAMEAGVSPPPAGW